MKQKDHMHIFRLLLGAAVLVFAALWVYTGIHVTHTQKDVRIVATSSLSMTGVATNTISIASSSRFAVNTNDDAVSAYLKEAQIHAEIYKFTNHSAYDGMCELTDKNDLFNLELGVLRYIKAVGATGVFCYTSSDQYMIEAKLPEKGVYFCIDSSGYAGEQSASHQKDHSCTEG